VQKNGFEKLDILKRFGWPWTDSAGRTRLLRLLKLPADGGQPAACRPLGPIQARLSPETLTDETLVSFWRHEGEEKLFQRHFRNKLFLFARPGRPDVCVTKVAQWRPKVAQK
jgi:hypothetical protein